MNDTVDRRRRYDTAEPFFTLGGSAIMPMTMEAARDASRLAAERGLLVVRVEGGIWHRPGFEARLDCIWDGLDPPATEAATHENNAEAAAFVAEEAAVHDVFILTTVRREG